MRIRARRQDAASCPKCGSTDLRNKDRYTREVRHESRGLGRCMLELECRKWRCKACGRVFRSGSQAFCRTSARLSRCAGRYSGTTGTGSAGAGWRHVRVSAVRRWSGGSSTVCGDWRRSVRLRRARACSASTSISSRGAKAMRRRSAIWKSTVFTTWCSAAAKRRWHRI